MGANNARQRCLYRPRKPAEAAGADLDERKARLGEHPDEVLSSILSAQRKLRHSVNPMLSHDTRQLVRYSHDRICSALEMSGRGPLFAQIQS
jgi:hypothetical protein